MARLVFAFIVFIHGLIHLLGFVKEWQLARVDQLTGKTLFPLGSGTAKVLGALWLVAFVAFAAAAAAFLMKKDWWWVVGLGAVVISQILIVIYWKDAFAGTIANAIILAVVIVSWAGWSFDHAARQESAALLAASPRASPGVVTADMVRGLPPPVQRWLDRSGVIGRPPITSGRLKQRGEMRTKPDGTWMPFEAEQVFTVDRPAFLWKARIRAMPLIYLDGKDTYLDGQGRMVIKLLSLVPIGDSRGSELTQGTLLRYLAEIQWFPSAALAPYVAWEPIDPASARATMTFGGTSASGVFSFTGDGDVAGFEAQRYGEFDGTYRKETWSIAAKGERVFDGVRIRNAGEVTWKLRSGDWTWLRLEITDLEFNRTEPF